MARSDWSVLASVPVSFVGCFPSRLISAAVELFTALEQALEDKTYITPPVTKGVPLDIFLRRAVNSGTENLTERQREVLELLAEI